MPSQKKLQLALSAAEIKDILKLIGMAQITGRDAFGVALLMQKLQQALKDD